MRIGMGFASTGPTDFSVNAVPPDIGSGEVDLEGNALPGGTPNNSSGETGGTGGSTWNPLAGISSKTLMMAGFGLVVLMMVSGSSGGSGKRRRR